MLNSLCQYVVDIVLIFIGVYYCFKSAFLFNFIPDWSLGVKQTND